MLDSSKINLNFSKIIIVDDNEHALYIVKDLLMSFGAKDISTAKDGVEAKSFLVKQQFDLLITDGRMPQCDGYELVRWLRSRPNDEERITPAIIISANTRESQVAAARDCGANYIIAKPISPQALLERIFLISTEPRSFIVCETFVGPDRRSKNQGPPRADGGRRKSDRALCIGPAVDEADPDRTR